MAKARLELTPAQWAEAQAWLEANGGIEGGLNEKAIKFLEKRGFDPTKGFRQTTLANGNIEFTQDTSDPALAQE